MTFGGLACPLKEPQLSMLIDCIGAQHCGAAIPCNDACNQEEKQMLDHEIERHLRELGVLPETAGEALSDAKDDPRHLHLAKGYFNDPRGSDGSVPF